MNAQTLQPETAKRPLPPGWRWVRLDSLVSCHSGAWGKESYYPGSVGVHIVGTSHITNDGLLDPAEAPMRYLASNEIQAICSEGDLLVVKSSGSATNIRSGKTAICSSELSGKIACSNFLMRLVPNKELIDPYLLWKFLNGEEAKQFVRLIASSSTYPNIKWSSYKELQVPLPPLAEQKRIAGILREQMAAVERARRAAEEQLEAAQALPAAYLRAVFPKTGEPLPPGWRWVRLGEVCEEDRKIVEPNSNLASNLPYLSLEHIESNSGRILKHPNERIEDEGKSMTFVFDNRHVLYGKLRPYLNKVALPDFTGRCTTEIIPLLPTEQIEREFLCWLLRRPETVEAAMKEKTGSRMPRANMSELMKLEIPLPPLAEQKRIAGILREQMASVDRLRKALEEQLEAINKLPAAFLRKAFSGQL